MQRPLYRKLIKLMKEDIEEQKGQKFIALSPGTFSMMLNINPREVEAVWQTAAKQLGLVDDRTGTNTLTLPGRGIYDI